MSRCNNHLCLQVLALQDEPGTQAFFSNYRQAAQRWHFALSALLSIDHTVSALSRHKDLLLQELVSLSAEEVYTILCLPAMSQEHVLTSPLPEGRQSISCHCTCYLCIAQDCGPALKPGITLTQQNPLAGTSFRTAVQQLASTLKRVETFYNSIGGLLGYHRKCLQIMMGKSDQQTAVLGESAGEVTFHMPQGPDLAGPQGQQLAAESAAAGLEALPHMAEIYPLGGMLLLQGYCRLLVNVPYGPVAPSLCCPAS